MSSDPQTNGSQLAPSVDDAQSSLTDGFNATQMVTAYAHAILNIVINPPDDSEVDWTSFNANLAAAKSHAQSWIDTLGPAVSSQVPQSIINYGNTFNAATGDILSILTSSNYNPTDAQKQQIIQLIDATLTELGIQKQTIINLQGPPVGSSDPVPDQVTTLRQFSAALTSDHTNLLTGANDVQHALNLNQQDIDNINTQITKVQAEIAKANTAATASEIGIGVGIFLAVAAFALAVATGGAAAPLAVGVVAVLGVGAAVGTTVAYSVQANEEISKLHKMQAELADEQRLATSLNGVADSVNNLVSQNEAAQTAMSEVLTMWETLEGKLQSVIDDLNRAEADTVAIIQALDIQAAQTAWAQLTDFATKMQEAASGATVQPPLVHPTADSAAA